MLFSERLGYKTAKEQLPIDKVDIDLRNALWSVYLKNFIQIAQNGVSSSDLRTFINSLWTNYFKLPIDTSPGDVSYISTVKITDILRNYFFDSRKWFEYYDILEFSASYAGPTFCEKINLALEKEKSAFRFVNGIFVQITSQIEIASIDESITETSSKYTPVNIHLNTALKLLSDKQNPNYRNSIKETISAVESMCKIFTKNDKGTLGEILAMLEKEGHLHSALKKSFSALYGYTSDEGGIRHGLIEGDRVVDFNEAKFMLVTCSAFINYLISREAVIA